jgi:hypothetical protein
MRTLIWGKSFVRAFKRTAKKHPGLRDDIEKSFNLDYSHFTVCIGQIDDE